MVEAAMDEADVRNLMKEKRPREAFEAIFGPMQIAGSLIWEYWVKFEGEFHTRFIEENPSMEAPKVYDTFQALSLKLNERHIEILERLRTIEQAKGAEQARLQSELTLKAAESAAKRFSAMVRDICTAGAFAVSLVIFSYLIINGSNTWPAIFMFACVLASGCAFFFGKFITVRGKDLAGA
jgi:hypothetical protein